MACLAMLVLARALGHDHDCQNHAFQGNADPMTDLARHATWREINAQPAIWQDWADAYGAGAVRAWAEGLAMGAVWFCCAHQSACDSGTIAAACEGHPVPTLRAVPTIDLTALPHGPLTDRNPLTFSFVRSGNSVDSTGTPNALAPRAQRLNITCDAANALGTRTAVHPCRIILHPAAHDAGFAMTFNLTTMLLTALFVFGPLPDLPARAPSLSHLIPSFTSHAHATRAADPVVVVDTGTLSHVLSGGQQYPVTA